MGSAGWQADWIWTASGWTIAAVGLALMAWALFWDRARGRKRCPKCWYDLSGAVATDAASVTGTLSSEHHGKAASSHVPCVCPECGRKIMHERMMTKSRRRWGWAGVAATVVLAAVQIREQPQRRMEQWTNWIPTTLLVMVADLDAVPQTNDLSDALWLRGSSLWFWQGAIVVFRENVPTAEELHATVVTRRVWPADEKAVVRIAAPESLRPIVGSRALRAHVRAGEIGAGIESRVSAPYVGFVCGMGGGDMSAAALPLSIGHHTIVVNGELESSAGDFAWVVRRWTQTLEVDVVSGIDEAVRGRITADLESRVRSGFVAGAETGCNFLVWWSPEPYEAPPGGFRLTLLRDGEELSSGMTDGGGVFLCWDAEKGATTRTKVVPPPEVLERLTLRIRGDARSTLLQTEQDWYWSGWVEVPVQVLLDKRDAHRAKKK